MTTKTIRRLKITKLQEHRFPGARRADALLGFRGAEWLGQKQFSRRLGFYQLFMRGGTKMALRAHGGFANIHSEKRRAGDSGKFGFELECDLPETGQDGKEEQGRFHYSLTIHDLDREIPKIEEYLYRDAALLLIRKKGDKPTIQEQSIERFSEYANRFPKTHSALLFFTDIPLARLLWNMELYRIDPISAKEPTRSESDLTKLEIRGHNLASVLSRLERDESIRKTIMDWMELIVPGLEGIRTEQQQLDSKTALLFKEQGTERRFPAHMVSDGTIYALSLLVAVLDLPFPSGLTLIEEPERGLHPAAIRELIDLMREQATPRNPIWLTTHSESVVRALNLEELILVDKVDGRTRMKSADSGRLTNDDLAPLSRRGLALQPAG